MTQPSLLIPYESIQKKKVLGQGAFGEVCLCSWTREEEVVDVAVKYMNNLTESMKKEFMLEVEVTSKLKNENICKVFGYSQNETCFMIVLEYINGGDLNDMFNKNLYNLLSWDRKWKLVEQVALSIHYLHTHDLPILHRDIKSPNFLITRDLTTLKLCDFGMSDLGLNLEKQIHGSTRWLAPEVQFGGNKWSTKSDVFAFAMTVFEITSSKLPFYETDDPNAVSELIKHERVRPELGQQVPEKFKTLMRKCWEHSADKRPTMTEVLTFVNAAKDNEDADFEISFDTSAAPSNPPLTARARNLKDKRLFFEIRKDDLINCCNDDQITYKTNPPKVPPHILGDYKLPQVPDKVTIVKLTRQFSINPLTSNSYATDIYQRVELLFLRFFDTVGTTNKVQLESVEIIFNDALEDRFRAKEQILHDRGEGIEALKDKSQSKLGRQYLKRLMMSDNLITMRNSNGLSAWHGANREKLESIMWYGLLNLSSRDPGYYGKAIYMTQEPSYGSYYTSQKAKEEGEFELLLCWATIGRPYAVTKVELGRPQEEGYDSHYVVVRHRQPVRDVFVHEADFKKLENNGEAHYPIRNFEEEKVQGDEIAIFDSDQALPRFIVSYKVLQNNLKSTASNRDSNAYNTVQACVNALNLHIDNKEEVCTASLALSELLSARTKPGEEVSFRQAMKIEQFAVETRSSDGLISLIKVMQKHSLVEELIASGVHVLRVCAQEDIPSREIIQKNKGIEIIIGSMLRFFDRESMLITANAALWHLSTNKVERVNIVKQGGIEAVINSVKRFGDNLELLTEAMGVMWKLSVDEETLDSFQRHDGVRYIVDSMRKFNDWHDLLVAGNGALWNLAVAPDDKAYDGVHKDLVESLKRLKAIEVVQDSLRRYSDVQEYALLHKQASGALEAMHGAKKKSILGRIASAYKMRNK
ncbi:MAPKKK protein [Acrasis kona]|uniref:MAPKKK protein n=1 Tax=Acrasis kona TaxID=1008807 RepID=A0AAW2YY63_9EUKA